MITIETKFQRLENISVEYPFSGIFYSRGQQTKTVTVAIIAAAAAYSVEVCKLHVRSRGMTSHVSYVDTYTRIARVHKLGGCKSLYRGYSTLAIYITRKIICFPEKFDDNDRRCEHETVRFVDIAL